MASGAAPGTLASSPQPGTAALRTQLELHPRPPIGGANFGHRGPRVPFGGAVCQGAGPRQFSLPFREAGAAD
ncbi:hypothetical protein GW7_04265 [Heterocephalus glaber]|uniref:Uncharacterized protein n=1 Tax=Heterocephalus glaber TaxID=10181 RepID=G5BK88_HETGA|nr:hypothetical protein GW7_04265 [Heterocephalus glaber]